MSIRDRIVQFIMPLPFMLGQFTNWLRGVEEEEEPTKDKGAVVLTALVTMVLVLFLTGVFTFKRKKSRRR